MKIFLFASASILIFNVFLFAQTDKVFLGCPMISVTEPSTVTQPGQPMFFTATVGTEKQENIEYYWTVSSGKILSGQGTKAISVSTEKWKNINTVVTIEIKGAPKGCPNRASGTGAVSIDWISFKIEEYQNDSFAKIKNRLKKIDTEPIEKGPFNIYFFIGISSRQKLKKAQVETIQIKDFLTKTRNIPPDRIFFVFNNFKTDRTTVFLVPFGAKPPSADNPYFR